MSKSPAGDDPQGDHEDQEDGARTDGHQSLEHEASVEVDSIEGADAAGAGVGEQFRVKKHDSGREDLEAFFGGPFFCRDWIELSIRVMRKEEIFFFKKSAKSLSLSLSSQILFWSHAEFALMCIKVKIFSILRIYFFKI